MKKQLFALLSLAVLAAMLVSPVAWQPAAVAAPPAPRSPAADPNTLTVCLGGEPNTLFPYGSPNEDALSVLAAVYDGPFDTNSYGLQPVILETIPDLSAGDALLAAVSVSEGARVVDFYNNVILLDAAASPPQEIRLSGETQPTPYTGGAVLMDQLVVTYTLKSGLLWADGQPLDSSDSLYSFNLADTPASGLDRTTLDRTQAYTALNSLQNQWIGLPGYLADNYPANFFTPYPEHIWGGLGFADLLTATISSETPLGYGPYVIDQWLRGDRILLHKNPNYFRAAEGLPRFQNLVFRFGYSARRGLAAILGGECDLVATTAGVFDELGLASALDNQGLVSLATSQNTAFEHLDFGIQHISYDDGYDYAQGDRPDWFSDRRLRQAVAYCLDRQQVVNQVFNGRTVIPDTYLSPSHPLANVSAQSYPYNPAAGAALLDQVGWLDHDSDPATPRVSTNVAGIPDGRELVLDYATTNAPIRQQITQILAESLRGCGIGVNLFYYDFGEFFDDGPNGILWGRKYELGEFAWIVDREPLCGVYQSTNTPGDPAETWIPVMNPAAGPQSFPNGWGGQSQTGFYNPAYDAACQAAVDSLPGQASYAANHLEAQRIFAEELPVIPLHMRLDTAAAHPSLAGFQLDPTAASDLWNIEAFARQPVPPRPPKDPGTFSACMAFEPGSLFPYDGNYTTGKISILQTVYDGPVDDLSYAYHPVILEKLPTPADGDVLLRTVTVNEGDAVVDADLNPITLDAAASPPQKIRLAGSLTPVEYTGGPALMDQIVVTYTLKSGLLWSDGAPLTAADSVYSFQLAASPDLPSGDYTAPRSQSYTALDDVQTRWVALPGFTDHDYATRFWTPYPQHVWGAYSPSQLLTATVSSETPLGYGPYVVDQWLRGDRILLHKNPNYFRAVEGLPIFDNLELIITNNDVNRSVAMLLAGECDFIDQVTPLTDLGDFLLDLEARGLLQLEMVTGTIWDHLDFSLQHISYDDGFSLAAGDRPDYFGDLRTRRGIAHCLDRQKAIDDYLYGMGSVPDTYLHPEHPLYYPYVRTYPYDPAQGSALLEQAGWLDPDNDPATPRIASGVAGVPDGTPFIVRWQTTGALLRQQVTQVFAQSLAGCGVQVNLEYLPASQWFSTGPDAPLFGRKFDLGQFGWVSSSAPSCELYSSKNLPGDPAATWIPRQSPAAGPQGFPNGWSGQNDPGYFNPVYDQACNTARLSLPGDPQFTAGHQQVQVILAEDLPILPLYLRLRMVAGAPDLYGLAVDSTNISDFWNIETLARYGLSGRFTDAAGLPIAGASVQVSRNASLVDTLTPDSQGDFVFRTVYTGTYTLAPQVSGGGPLTFFPPNYTLDLPVSASGLDFVAAEAYNPVNPTQPQSFEYFGPQGSRIVVQVPANAVTSTVNLLYSSMGSVNTKGSTGVGFGLTAAQNNVPLENFTFQAPVTVQIYYNTASVAGKNEGLLNLYTLEDGKWVEAACGPVQRSTGGNWLRVPICHLSRFAMLSRAELYLPLNRR